MKIDDRMNKYNYLIFSWILLIIIAIIYYADGLTSETEYLVCLAIGIINIVISSGIKSILKSIKEMKDEKE